MMDIEKILLAANAVINARNVREGFNAVADYMEAVSPRDTLALLGEIKRLTAERDELLEAMKAASRGTPMDEYNRRDDGLTDMLARGDFDKHTLTHLKNIRDGIEAAIAKVE